MKKTLILFVLTLIVTTTWAQARMPLIRVDNISKEESPVRISQVKIDVKVVGSLAVTTVDMTIHNPNSRVMEGELEFPLADGQSISRYALDINGKMREGVVVEKAKGQAAFETIVRRGVDPGLLEKTEGNNFRTRVYPLFAKGPRRVIIGYEQELVPDGDKYRVFLPVEYGDVLDKFNLNLVVHANDRQPQVDETPWGNFAFSRSGDAYTASFSAEKYNAKGQLVFSVPVKKDIQLYVENGKIDNKTVFYTQILPEIKQTDKRLPSQIALFWDASLSMQERNFRMESTLLDKYFSKIGNLTVSLYTFNCKENKPQQFTIRNGNWSELKTVLQNMIYDGATQMGLLNLQAVKADEILFFSDGMSNFGKIAPVVGNTPIMAVNSLLTADYSMLKYLSSSTGGVFINLMQQSSDEALKQLTTETIRLISVDYNKEEISDLTTSGSTINLAQGLSIAGKLIRHTATLTLKLGKGNQVTTTEQVTISAADAADYDNMVERLWASKRIAELDILYNENRREIGRIAKKYNIVTRNTSLIVLEQVMDYVVNEITPPEELREDYNRIRTSRMKDKSDNTEVNINYAVNLWKERQEWWDPQSKKEYVIHGTIKNEKGEPLSAFVRIENRLGNAVQASYDGHFLIKAQKEDKLVFTITGYEQQRMTVKGDEQVSIVLKPTKPVKVADNNKGKKSPKVDQIIRTGGRGDYTVNGVAKEDSTGEPIIGATIAIKGTDQGTISDIDGRFSIKANRDEVLEFKYIGFETKEMTVTGNMTVDIYLKESSQHLEEVVVTGYGTSPKKTIIGAVSAVRAEDLNRVKGLAGSVAGVVVSSSNANNTVDEEVSVSTVSLKGWQSDAPYMKELKAKADKELYAAYIAIRKDYLTAPSFYLDVATLFEERGMKEEAFLVLSNLAEMNLENYRVLRVLAHRLLQLGYIDYAIHIFEKVKELRPEEAQSFRDLGLAYAENKAYQKAIDELYEIITRKWDGRFPEIQVFAVEEINNIVAKAKKNEIDVSKIDNRLLFNMPVDIRIVLNWDTDNSDMDLWVTDPNDEKCYYKNKLTKAKGMITRDLRNGYGPEAFLIKKAPKGKYIIEADYFGTREQTLIGPTTIYLDVYTYYGTPKETKKTIMLRLDKDKGEVEIGEIEF